MSNDAIRAALNPLGGIDINEVMPFNLAVNMGRIPGYSVVDKFGVVPQVTTATDPADIWEHGGVYPFDTNGTAPIQYTSSSSALDTGQTVNIQGLDINGDFVEQTVNTNGQSVVDLTTPLWRVYRMQNDSDTGNDINGILYCHTDSTPSSGVPNSADIRAMINDGHNQTLMCIYTVPKGKVGFLYRGELGVELEGNAASLSEYAHLHYESRRYGKLFKVKKAITCIVGGSATYQDARSFPDIIPALTDIRLRAVEVTMTMGLWGTFDILLVDENIFPETYLQGIGQPGY